MYAKLIWLCVLFNFSCSAFMIVSTYPPEKMLPLMTMLRAESQSQQWNIQTLNHNKREKICSIVLQLNYFYEQNKQYADKNKLYYHDRLLKERSMSYDLHYIEADKNGAHSVPNYLAIDDVIIFSEQYQDREILFPCLCEHEDEEGTHLEDVFISSGYREDLYLLYQRDANRNIVPLGIVTQQPEVVSYSNENALEKFYIEQRKQGSSEEGSIMQKLKKFETQVHVLVFLIFEMPIFEMLKLEFLDRENDILYAGETLPLKFRMFHEDLSIPNWSVDVIPVRIYEKDQEAIYYIGQSHQGEKSVFIFKDSINKGVELFMHITNLSILDSGTRIAGEGTRIAGEGDWENFSFASPSTIAQLNEMNEVETS